MGDRHDVVAAFDFTWPGTLTLHANGDLSVVYQVPGCDRVLVFHTMAGRVGTPGGDTDVLFGWRTDESLPQ
jgi:hypothetical protein